MDNKFITLAIHTFDHAISLRKILEAHGMEVKLEKLVLSGMNIVSGIRVKINEHDLPLALKITESIEHLKWPEQQIARPGHDGILLIPVDFKPYSILACRMGFELAGRLALHPVILHAFAAPYFGHGMMYDTLTGEPEEDFTNDMAEIEIGNDLWKDSKSRMRDLRKKIEQEQESGQIPSIQFSCTVEEGVPEDVIKEYCRINSPALVVMATRGKQKKGEELVGSVTAEVLDACRVPIFSIPEDGKLAKLEQIKRLVFFCNLDHQDIISIDTLMRMFDYPEVDVALVPLDAKGIKDVGDKVESLKDYCNKSYPAAHFSAQVFRQKNFLSDFENYEVEAAIDMLVVPNKHRNALLRLLNPGIAHKLLFERDLPLLALPV